MDTVLFVDDDTMVLQLLEQIAKIYDFKAEFAGSGYEALKKIDSSIGLVVTDVNMPGMNGITLADRIRKRHSGLMVVAHTSCREQHIYKHFDKVIPKPFPVKKLIAMITSCMQGQRNLQPA